MHLFVSLKLKIEKTLREKSTSTAKVTEKAILIGVQTQAMSDMKSVEYLDELSFLVETAGAEEIKRFHQKLEKPHPKTYIGSGKLEEVKIYMKDNPTDLVVFDDELSPSQVRNLEKELESKIIDRSLLILDIFAKNAQTAQAKTQVELAQAQYLLPRLTRMWTHLSKQKGGIGMKGPGETEIETDRRILRDKISLLKEKLKEIDKRTHVQSKQRDQKIRVALVGYTNVGKSTIMNLLSKADLLAENKLFATLDATVRKVVLEYPAESGKFFPILLSDTVGFIRKLPHQLVECFKSTLEEAKNADVLIHVVDVSHVAFEEQITVVKETLTEIGAEDKPSLMVFNKTDLYESDDEHALIDLKRSWMANENKPVVFISAQEKDNVEELKEVLGKLCLEVAATKSQDLFYNNY